VQDLLIEGIGFHAAFELEGKVCVSPFISQPYGEEAGRNLNAQRANGLRTRARGHRLGKEDGRKGMVVGALSERHRPPSAELVYPVLHWMKAGYSLKQRHHR